jgi:hypothetical protein
VELVWLPLALTALGCSVARPPLVPPSPGLAAGPPRPGMSAPATARGAVAPSGIPYAEHLSYAAVGPVTIALREVPAAAPAPEAAPSEKGRIDSPLPEEVTDLLRQLALLQPPAAGVQTPAGRAPTAPVLTAGAAFESLEYGDPGADYVPPDNEIAVGPSHILAVVNSTFEIYDKSGSSLLGPTSIDSFFASAAADPPFACSLPFDPSVLYDEAADRFILGTDAADGSRYCVAASKTGDPTGDWWAYSIPTDIGGAFSDFPQAGVGREAIFVGANQFDSTTQLFLEGRVFAWDKAAMYGGGSLVVTNHSTGGDSTPQPVNLHGWAQGTWPAAGPHYVLTETFDGSNHSVWSWDFATDTFIKLAPDLDLAAAAGVPCDGGVCFPVDAPQMDPPPPPDPPDPAGMLQANDYRGLDAEYRNGSIWTTQSVSCNPGNGVVDCVRWAEIDPTVPAVVQAGVFGSDGEYRLFPDTAANHCGDMAVGYSKTGTTMHPGAFVTGRRFDDPAGTLPAAEETLKGGETVYDAFDGSPHRWGDYSGMTVDPDGLTFWYIGEYSKDIVASANWGTWVGSFSYGCPVIAAAPATVDFGGVPESTSSPASEITISNDGNDAHTFTAMVLSDTTNFALDVAGGTTPCNSTVASVGAGAACTVEVSFQPMAPGPFAATLTLESANPANTRVVTLQGIGYIECTAPDTVDLATPDPVMDYTACVDILAGPWVIDQAITLTAGDRIGLRDGLVIETGVDVSLVTDPFLGPP